MAPSLTGAGIDHRQLLALGPCGGLAPHPLVSAAHLPNKGYTLNKEKRAIVVFPKFNGLHLVEQLHRQFDPLASMINAHGNAVVATDRLRGTLDGLVGASGRG